MNRTRVLLLNRTEDGYCTETSVYAAEQTLNILQRLSHGVNPTIRQTDYICLMVDELRSILDALPENMRNQLLQPRSST